MRPEPPTGLGVRLSSAAFMLPSARTAPFLGLMLLLFGVSTLLTTKGLRSLFRFEMNIDVQLHGRRLLLAAIAGGQARRHFLLKLGA